VYQEVRRSIGRIGVCVTPAAAGGKSGAWRKAYRASGAHNVVSSRRAGRRSINLPGRGVNPIAYPPEKKNKNNACIDQWRVVSYGLQGRLGLR